MTSLRSESDVLDLSFELLVDLIIVSLSSDDDFHDVARYQVDDSVLPCVHSKIGLIAGHGPRVLWSRIKTKFHDRPPDLCTMLRGQIF